MIALALHLGRTPRELAATLGSDELTELLIYCQDHPLDDGWTQSALIRHTIANAFRAKRKTIPLARFLPSAGRRKRTDLKALARSKAAEIRGTKSKDKH